MVDLMGSKYLGRNTVLSIVDGLFAGGGSELEPPVKYYMSPFNNDWCNSIFISEDQVALESVCYDFLRTEWDGTNDKGTKCASGVYFMLTYLDGEQLGNEAYKMALIK